MTNQSATYLLRQLNPESVHKQ